jgi:hypothetical protein
VTKKWVAELEQSYVQRFPDLARQAEGGWLEVKGNLRIKLLRIEANAVELELQVIQPQTKIVMAKDEVTLTPSDPRIDFERMEIDLKVKPAAHDEE